MNIVKMILDFLLSSRLGDLSALLGENEEKTKSVVQSAVPALLSGLSSLATSREGAQQLSSILGKFDAGTLESLGNLVSGSSSEVAEKGNSMLGSLFTGNVLSGIVGVLSKFAGVDGSKTQGLLGYLAPLVLGGIAKQFVGKSITPEALTGFFSDQKSNIASAMPSGLSLADVPGLGNVRSGAEAAYTSAKEGYDATRDAAESGSKWLLPVVGLAVLAAIAYFMWKPAPPATADIAKATTDIGSTFTSLTDTLADITDSASAEGAVPKLTALGGEFEGMKALVDELPEAGKSKIVELIKSSMGDVTKQFERVLSIPGIPDSLRPALQALLNKIATLAGLPADTFTLPAIEARAFHRAPSSMVAVAETLAPYHRQV